VLGTFKCASWDLCYKPAIGRYKLQQRKLKLHISLYRDLRSQICYFKRPVH